MAQVGVTCSLRLFKDIMVYLAIAMSVIKEISRMSKSGCDNKELLDYIYMRITMRLNVNSMEMSIKIPKSVITIFALTVTWKNNRLSKVDFSL